MYKLLVICGPTATGKTTLAARLAKEFNGELISADSRQVYRGMDLTTGKERPDVPIWLYDVVNPDDEFSVSHWVKLAEDAILDIRGRNKLPIVVGGTGLYIKALLDPFETIDIPRDEKLRNKLQKLSVSELQKMLPRSNMNQSDWNNPRRLIRKIEIKKYKKLTHKKKEFDSFMIGLAAPLPILYERIDRRLEERMKQGMNEEIEKLIQKYGRDVAAMSAIGLNEHAYARRQMTWFRRMPDIHWFDITKNSYEREIIKTVRTWYTKTV